MTFSFLTNNFFIALLVVSVFSQPIKIPWANSWSQSYVQYNLQTHQNTMGTIWYDWTLPAIRYDFANSFVEDDCSQLMQQNTPCTFLVKNGLFFLIYSQKRLCGNFGIVADVPAPDQVVKLSTYLQTKSISGKDYFVWNNTEYYYRNYMTTSDQKQIYYKQIYTQENKTMKDYMVNSYSQKVDKKIFDIPKYCYENSMLISSQKRQKILNNLDKKFKIKELKITDS